MARNVEIKAFAPDFVAVSNKAHALSSVAPETIAQTDVFFKTDRGRLKLRFLSPVRGELIFYERADQAGPKMSTYSRYSSDRPADLRDVLAATYGEDVTVAPFCASVGRAFIWMTSRAWGISSNWRWFWKTRKLPKPQ